MNAPGAWELILLVLALAVVGSLVYAFVWTVRRFTERGSRTSARLGQDVDALRSRVDELERRQDEQRG